VEDEPDEREPRSQPATERAAKEAMGEGEPGGAESVTDEAAVDQADTADARL
jgi:hypothetical protein